MIPTTLPVNLYMDGLSEWRWAISGSEIAPVVLSIFGDWFYLKRDGIVYVVDTLEGKETVVSENMDSFTNSMKIVEFRDRWFLESFINRMNKEKIEFSMGQCVGWKIPPIVGGKFEYENLDIFDYKVYNNVTSQIVRQLRGVA